MRITQFCLLAVISGLTFNLPVSVAAEPAAIVYHGGRILTAAGKTYDPGTLVVRDGKIDAVGPAAEIEIPEGAEAHDASGKVIIPGLVDSHSHLGVYSRPSVKANSDGNEMTGPVQSVVRALDSLNPFDPGIRMANAGGVTTANIMPGSGNVIGGQTIYVKLRGYTPEQMWIASPDVLGGLKMANGENPKRSYGSKGQAPGTRMKIAALQRTAFLKALDYRRKWDRYRKELAAGEEPTPPDVDLGLEALVEVLQKKRTVHFHSHRADDILTVLRLKEEFDFDLLIQHGTESYKIVDEIARRGVPVSMTIPDSPGGKAEVVAFIEECGAELAKAGVKVLVNTDDPVTESRFLLRTTAIAVRGGLDEETALKAITLHGAEVMRLDHRIGSLEEGKDADFVVLSGPPFSVYCRVLETYIDGKRVFQLADSKERLYQTGGFAVREPKHVPEAKPLITPLSLVEAPQTPSGSAQADGESNEFVILAGRVHTAAGESIEQGAVHVRDGKIVAVGPQQEIEIPAGVPVVAATEVTPGLIDAHSVVPLEGEYNIRADQDSNELSDPNQADVRVLDGFNPSEPLLEFLLQQGITTVHVCPGRDNVIAGLSGVFHTYGRTPEAMTIRFPQAMVFNLGEWPKEAYDGRKPRTRMGTASLIREALTGAANFSRKKNTEEDADKVPDRDLKREALVSLLQKKIPAMFCAQRGDDILTALRLGEEFKLDVNLALAAEGYLVADAVKAAGVPVIVHPTMQPVRSMETYNSFLGNAAALSDREIPIAIGSGAETYVPKTRVVRYEAAMGMVYGLGRRRALEAVTLGAAKILGIDDRYGSLEAGKVADIVLYSGDPFEHKTQVTHVVVDGKIVYSRADRPQIPLALRQYYSSPNIPCCLD